MSGSKVSFIYFLFFSIKYFMNLNYTASYDSEFCGSIPIHLINLVQPHGFLLVLDKTSHSIIQASENVQSFIKVPASDLLKKEISSIIDGLSYERLLKKLTGPVKVYRSPETLKITTVADEIEISCIVHVKDEFYILECENIDNEHSEAAELYERIKYLLLATKNADDVKEISEIAAKEIKRLIGYDKVMIYQFDSSWNGTVIAEELEEGMDSYLGLRFPASDVPKQARDLYFKNPYRIIPDRNQIPVPLIPVVNPVTTSFIDLSECNLRAVPTVHLTYLKNMNVTASLSVPIIIDNLLWGLIACHNRSPKNVSFENRAHFELISSILATQISSKEKELALRHKTGLNEIKGKVVEQMYSSNTFIDGLLNKKELLLKLLGVTGAAITFFGEITVIRETPSAKEIRNLVSWLQRNYFNNVFSTDYLPKIYEQAKPFKEIGSGLIALPISPKNGNFILGFRPEVFKTVEWGGNPNQAINFVKDGRSYNPRNSFEIWKETVENTSKPWLQQELEIAESLRISILEILLNKKS
jgi:two-component system, chemotaxis family, sensor kinase Cph1